MLTKPEMTEHIRSRFRNAKERAGVLVRAFRVRVEILATRRRLRARFAEMGEEIYEGMKTGSQDLGGVPRVVSLKIRIDGLKSELSGLEEKLKNAPEGDMDGGGPDGGLLRKAGAGEVRNRI